MYPILAEMTTRGPNWVGLSSALVVMVIYGFIIALVIVVLLRLARYLGNAGKEQQRIRMEMTKVADEVHQMRKDIQSLSADLKSLKES